MEVITLEQEKNIIDLFLHLKDKRLSTISRITGRSQMSISKIIDKYIELNELKKSYVVIIESKINYMPESFFKNMDMVK